MRDDFTESQTLRSKPGTTESRRKHWSAVRNVRTCVSESRFRKTYTFKVEMRHRQSPSLVRLFLCLKPPIILSHTYCRQTNAQSSAAILLSLWAFCRFVVYLRVGRLVHDLQQQSLVLLSNLILGVSQSVYEAWQS